jgi:hypothetical protein
MDINTFITYLLENRETLPTKKCFNTHFLKAFNKIREFKDDATIQDVYCNFDMYYENMKGLTDYSLRNYLQCFEVALELENVRQCFTNEEFEACSLNLKLKVRELNKVCNALRKSKEKGKVDEEVASECLTFKHDNQSNASPLDIDDIVNDTLSSEEDTYESFAKEYKQLRQEFDTLQSNHEDMQVQYNNLNLDLAVTKMKLNFTTNENARLWELLNNMVKK